MIFFSLKTEDSKRPVVFESRGNMGEELESLRTTIDDRHIYDNSSTSIHPKSPRRRKRFLSYPRYVELMVTADAKMVRHHGRNLEHYILTIMSVVSKIMFLNIFYFSQCWRYFYVMRVILINYMFSCLPPLVSSHADSFHFTVSVQVLRYQSLRYVTEESWWHSNYMQVW